ncbi:MAG: VCBS repeat-containing protein [Fuerstiella sp.]|nr:VCBS repeat-containing protein [Fuerstiella sp.]
MIHRLVFFIVVSGLLLVPETPGAFGQDTTESADLAQFYGFTGVELFELNGRAGNMIAGHFSPDNRIDLLLVDNRDSCLKLLRQRLPEEQEEQASKEYVNDLPSDRRFEFQEIPVDKEVAGLTSGDFNADGRTDIAYVGMPDRLVIRYQNGDTKADWNTTWSVRLPELTAVAWMISAGDLNGDHRSDLVVLGKTAMYIIYQNDDGEMDSPQRLINTSAQLSLLQVADINGDGRDDTCYMATEGSYRGLCARLQTIDGRLGPELNFNLNQSRSVTICDIDTEPGREIVTIDRRTGRLVISRLENPKDVDPSAPRSLVHFGIGNGKSSGQNRAVAVGDVDGDGLSDVVVTDPEDAQVLVFRQNGIDGLAPAEIFPGLLGATDACLVDIDSDARRELVLMSEPENMVALSRFQNGRLTFPKPLTRAEKSQSLCGILVMRAGEQPSLAICTKFGGRNKKNLLGLRQMSLSSEGTARATDRMVEFDAAGVNGKPGVRLLKMDANVDGTDDLLIVPQGSGSEGVITFLSDENGLLSEAPHPHRLSLGKGTSGPLFVHHHSLLVGRGAFARAMKLEDQRWAVVDQFNAAEEKARISGAVGMDYDNDGTDEIVLIDTGIDRLRILRNESGLFRPWREVETGAFRFRSAVVADLNGDSADDLLLVSDQRISVLYSGCARNELTEIATWESDREDAYAADVISGDFNGDDVIDLAVIDTGIDGLELLNFSETNGIRAATHFRVFEEKRLVSSADSRGTEPREGIVADVTGDGRRDLVLLCHDQLIVYPQDSVTETTE